MDTNPYLLILLGFVIVFAFGWYYFNTQPTVLTQGQLPHAATQTASVGKPSNRLNQ